MNTSKHSKYVLSARLAIVSTSSEEHNNLLLAAPALHDEHTVVLACITQAKPHKPRPLHGFHGLFACTSSLVLPLHPVLSYQICSKVPPIAKIGTNMVCLCRNPSSKGFGWFL